MWLLIQDNLNCSPEKQSIPNYSRALIPIAKQKYHLDVGDYTDWYTVILTAGESASERVQSRWRQGGSIPWSGLRTSTSRLAFQPLKAAGIAVLRESGVHEVYTCIVCMLQCLFGIVWEYICVSAVYVGGWFFLVCVSACLCFLINSTSVLCEQSSLSASPHNKHPWGNII